MTSDTGKDKPGLTGADQRPRATIDLKATEIFPEGKKPEPESKPEAAPKMALPPGDAASRAETGPSSSADASQNGRHEAGIGSFLTHMAAGLVGAVLALGGAWYYGSTRGGDEATAKALADMQQRVAAVEANARRPADTSGLDGRIKTVTDQTASIKQDVGSLGGRVQALETRPAGTAGPSPEAIQQSIDPLNAKIAALESRVATIGKSQDELRASTGSAALTMAVQNLRRAVADGKPFSAELKTLATLAPEPLEVAPLDARRDKGLASLTKLQQDFDASAKVALDAAKPNGDGSFTGDLLAKARGLVRVRPTGDIAGDAPEAILARAEHRLDSGDLQAAIREAGLLAGPAAQAMTPWLTEAKAKAAADEALAKIEAKLASAPATRGG